MDTIFAGGNFFAMGGWLVLLAGVFAPPARRIAFPLAGFIMPAALSAAYLGLLAVAVTGSGAAPDFSTLAGVKALLSSDAGATTGWYHYLAFDLFIGGWIARDAHSRGLSPWWLPPILLMTFMAGPVGLLAYLGLRTVRGSAAAGLASRLPITEP